MTKEEAIKYCHDHRQEYIESAPGLAIGARDFTTLIDNLKSGYVSPLDLAEFGMEFKEATDGE